MILTMDDQPANEGRRRASRARRSVRLKAKKEHVPRGEGVHRLLGKKGGVPQWEEARACGEPSIGKGYDVAG